jgi:hypothetical protein
MGKKSILDIKKVQEDALKAKYGGKKKWMIMQKP